MTTLGDSLLAKGQLYAAQFCYIVSVAEWGTFAKKGSKLVLLCAQVSPRISPVISLYRLATSLSTSLPRRRRSSAPRCSSLSDGWRTQTSACQGYLCSCDKIDAVARKLTFNLFLRPASNLTSSCTANDCLSAVWQTEPRITPGERFANQENMETSA